MATSPVAWAKMLKGQGVGMTGGTCWNHRSFFEEDVKDAYNFFLEEQNEGL